MALTQISTQGIKDGTITGTDLATNIDLVDNQKLRLGTGNDLEIYHDGSSSYIDNNGIGNLFIRGNNTNAIALRAVQSENSLICHANAQVQLYYDNSLKLETTNTGATVTGILRADEIRMGDSGGATSPNERIRLGNSEDLEIYHDGTNSFIKNTQGQTRLVQDYFAVRNGADNEYMIYGQVDNTVQLYYDGSLKLNTTTYGAKVTGRLAATTSITGADNVHIKLGDSDDLQIYHDGTHSRIYNSTGDLVLGSPNTIAIKTTGGSENMITAVNNGAVNLFYDNSKKFETTSTGAKVSGRFEQFGNSTGNNQTNTGFARNLYNVEIAHNATKTFTFTGLNGGWATIKMGGYSSNGGSAMSFRAELGGWMFYTSTANYGSTEPQNHTHNVSTSVTKNATSYVVSVTNNASNSATLGVNLCTEATQTAFSVAIS